jgi:hypothetical protein
MTPHTEDMQAVLERLEKLERQNRRLRAVALLAIVASVVALSLAAVVSFNLGTRQVPQPTPTATFQADKITAHEFVLAGRKGGHPIAVLTNDSGGNSLDIPTLQFFGPEPMAAEGRVLRMTISVNPDPEITVYHAFGPLKSGNDELLSLAFPGNEPHLLIRSGRGNLSGMNPGGLALWFDDQNRPVLTLRGKGGRVLWSTP